MTSMRRTALVAGILYLVTFASSISAVFLLGPALTNPDYITGGGGGGQVRFGAFLDLVNALACIGTAVALYSVVKRQHEGFALGFVTTRMFEAAVLAVGVLSMLSIVTLRETGAAGADASALVTVGQSLVAVRDWSFAIGTGMAGLNALLLGWLMYRSRLVPRLIPAVGIIGAPLFTSYVIGFIFGLTEEGSLWHLAGVAPIILWELSLGLWMAIRGFNPSAPLMVAAASDDAAATSSIAPRVTVATKAGPA